MYAARSTWIFAKVGREYGIKIVIAILLTPAVYGIHSFVVRVLKISPESHAPATPGGAKAPRGP